MLTTTTEPQAQRGWPTADELQEWIGVLHPEMAAASKLEANRQLALWVRLLASAVARELLLPEAAGGGRSSIAQ